jgi:hypothetical protein
VSIVAAWRYQRDGRILYVAGSHADPAVPVRPPAHPHRINNAHTDIDTHTHTHIHMHTCIQIHTFTVPQ